MSEERAARIKRFGERRLSEEKEEQRRRDAMPPISVTVRVKDAEDITITVKPWQRVFESVVKGLDPNHLWTDLDEVRYGETKLATSTTWEAEGNSSLCDLSMLQCDVPDSSQLSLHYCLCYFIVSACPLYVYVLTTSDHALPSNKVSRTAPRCLRMCAKR